MFVVYGLTKMFAKGDLFSSHSSDNVFLQFLREYRKEIYETYIVLNKFSLITRNIRIIHRCPVVAKNQQKITYDREFSIVKSGGLKYINF